MQGKAVARRVYTSSMIEEGPFDHAPPKVSNRELAKLTQDFFGLNPSMTPQEAYDITKKYRDARNSLKDPKIYESDTILRNLRLFEYGIDPTKCVLYETVQPKEVSLRKPDVPLQEEELAYWASKLPKGLELFALQGEISSLSPEEVINTKGKFYNKNAWWEIYLLEPQQ